MNTPEHILRELGITSPSDIDVEVIAWHCGLEVQYKELQSCDARIVGAGDRGLLSVDINKSPERKRFSVAHEIGHWQLHRGQIMMCRAEEIDVGKASNSTHERDADSFAAALLMPAYLFEPAANLVSKKEPWTQVSELSSIFRTSTLATALRLVNLGIWQGWLVCHGKQGRRWFRKAHTSLMDAFPRQELDDRSTAFDMVFGTAQAAKPRTLPGDAWFDSGSFARKQVLEHARRYGSDEVLVFVRFQS
jgi:hypothetical protein